jgi:hypothetical protein
MFSNAVVKAMLIFTGITKFITQCELSIEENAYGAIKLCRLKTLRFKK